MQETMLFRKIASSLLVVSVFMIALAPLQVRAYWSDAIPAAYIKQGLEEAYDQIQGAILGAEKALSVQVLYQQVVNSIAGGGNGVRYVTNVDDFMRIQPERQAEIILNDFLADTTRGTNTCGYVSEKRDPLTGELVTTGGSTCSPSDGLNFSRNYLQRITDDARKYVMGEVKEKSYELLDEVCPPDLETSMFAEGNLRCFNTFISYNGWGLNIEAEETFRRNLEEEKRQTEAQFVAYKGFLPTTAEEDEVTSGSSEWTASYMGTRRKDQTVLTPGSVIADITAQVSNLGSLVAAGTSNPAEFLGYMAGAYVNRMVLDMVNNGIGEARSVINKEVRQINRNVRNVEREIENTVAPVRNFEIPY